MQQFSHLRTVSDALRAESPSIGSLQRQQSKSFVEGLIMAWLAYLNSVLNLNKPLNDDQIELCAKLIAEEYYAVTFADLSLIFRRVVTGQMGELYEALSIPKILSWFAVYFDERCNAAGEMSAMEHEKFTKATSSLAASKNLDRRFRT